MSHRWMKFWPADWRADPALRSVSPAARGLWIDLLTLMHEAEPYGHLLIGGVAPTPRRLASVLSMREKEVVSLLDDLRSAGVCSETDEGIIYSRRMVRDAARQEIFRLHGKKGGNPTLKGGVNPTLNAPLILQEAESEAETDRVLPFGQNSRARGPRASAPREPTGFPEFWALYPAKVGKQAALKAWPKAVRSAGGDPLQIVLGLKTRLHLFNTDFIPNPATWLNQGRWDDDPETLLNRQRSA
jgi:hypothetical protein